MNGWSDERRAKQREAIKRWKPWQKSTGPRTEQGKERAAGNALKHGRRIAVVRRLRTLLRHQQDWLRLVRAHLEQRVLSPNELLEAVRNVPKTEAPKPKKEFWVHIPERPMLYYMVKNPLGFSCYD